VTLLIVDDEEPAVAGTAVLLDWASLGFGTVLRAGSAAEALALFETNTIDLLISDIEMPGESGIELIRRLKPRFPGLEIILLTSHEKFAYAQEALSLGCGDYVLKPAEAPLLEAAVRKALARIQAAREAGEYRRYGDLWLAATGEGFTGGGSTGGGGQGTEAAPDYKLWAQLLSLGQQQILEKELARYRRRVGRTDAGFILRFHQDFMQMVYSTLAAAGIEAHRLFESEAARAFMAKPVRTGDDLFAWALAVLGCSSLIINELKEGEPLLAKVDRYIDEHIAESLRREDIADHVFLNADYLSRLVKRERGLPLAEYIQKKRMDLAAQLLRESEASISDIALQAGYDNFSLFAKIFRKHSGQSPRQYRKSRIKSENC
jgi:YesN/AraC family two-component response regulator